MILPLFVLFIKIDVYDLYFVPIRCHFPRMSKQWMPSNCLWGTWPLFSKILKSLLKLSSQNPVVGQLSQPWSLEDNEKPPCKVVKKSRWVRELCPTLFFFLVYIFIWINSYCAYLHATSTRQWRGCHLLPCQSCSPCMWTMLLCTSGHIDTYTSHKVLQVQFQCGNACSYRGIGDSWLSTYYVFDWILYGWVW